jgi:DNA-binding transcriptional LysR family regulator
MFDPDYALFAAIVDAGSLSAAGKALGMSPAMVSKRLARLETRLGVQLIHRTTRRLSLTEPGERFHQDVVAILSAIEDAEERLTGSAGQLGGTLRVTAPTSFGRLHVAPRLGAFLDAHPGVLLDIDLSDGFVDLVAERVDVAIRIASRVESHLEAHRLGTSGRILCASPDYIASAGTPASIAELRRHRLLAAKGQLPWRLAGPDGEVTVDGASHVRTNSSEMVRELALAGVGVALRSLWDVNRELTTGQLVRVLGEYRGSAEVGIFAVHPRAAFVPPAVTAFIAFLRTLPAPWER